MAFWSRRTVLILLASLMLLSVIIRYPLVEHERYQSDSYFIHNLADAVAVEEYASWTYHPLSYVGYYPLSYPSGTPFLLAEFSVMSGLSVDVSIIILNIIVATIFCFAVFLMARHFTIRIEFAVLATFFAILGSRFVDTSYWDASARAPVVALLTLAAMIFLGARIAGRRRMAAVGAVIGLCCFALHHMAILLILFGIAYIVTMFETDLLFKVLRTRGRRAIIAITVFTTALIVIAPFLLFDYFWVSAIRGFQESDLFDVDSIFLKIVLTAATSYTNQIGFILLFAVAYMPILAMKPNLTSRDLLPVTVVIIFLPIFGETLYVSMILTPFIAIIGTLWFANAFKKPGKRMRTTVILVVLMTSSIALPFWSTDRWNSETFASGDRVLVENQIFNDAYYAMENTDADIAMCNVIPVTIRMEALSRVGFMDSGISLVLNGDVTGDEIREGIRQSSVAFPKNIYNWFDYDQEPRVRSYVRNLMIQGTPYLYQSLGIEGGSEYFATHSRLMVAIDNRWPSEYLTTHAIIDARFPGELLTSRSIANDEDYSGFTEMNSYVYYRSNLLSMFLVQLPLVAE